MQFEKAQFPAEGPQAQACARCGQPLSTTFYEVDGQATCANCHAALLAGDQAGLPIWRFIKAGFLGMVGGAIGALIYFGVLKAFDIHLGLISIVMGLLVGAGVSIGSEKRGGWLYQALALAITYFSLGASFVPVMMAGMDEAATTQAAPTTDVPAVRAPAPTAEEQAAAEEATAEGKKVDIPRPILGVLFLIIGPVAICFESPLMIFIQGIAFYEAWKLNKRKKRAIFGPFQLNPPAPAAAPVASAMGGGPGGV